MNTQATNTTGIPVRKDHGNFNKYSQIKVNPVPGPIGAVVECGDVRKINSKMAEELRRAWSDHLVLVFRGQTLTDKELMEFAENFGGLEKGVPTSIAQADKRENDYIVVVSNVMKNGVAIGSLGDGEAIWHTDMSFNKIPPAGSFLYALEVSASGGETGVSNMYYALETLPTDLRKKIDGLTIFNDGRYNSAGVLRRAYDSSSHPIVRTHPETGCNALYLGRRPLARINELPADESENLLNTLWAHATQEKFAWHHTWKVGDILVWDNRCAMHHRNPFPSDSRRIMHRVQTVGTPPVCEAYVAPPHQRHHLYPTS